MTSLQTISSMLRRRKFDDNSPATPFGGLTRSKLMSRIRSTKNATTELKMVRLLRRYRLRMASKSAGLRKTEFVWQKEAVALFVDGCFWHGHNCGRNLTPGRNTEFWTNKIMRNKQHNRPVSVTCDHTVGLYFAYGNVSYRNALHLVLDELRKHWRRLCQGTTNRSEDFLPYQPSPGPLAPISEQRTNKWVPSSGTSRASPQISN